MIHCPECDAEVAAESDVGVVDPDATVAFRSSKRFSVVAYTDCGAAVGSGVAGGGG